MRAVFRLSLVGLLFGPLLLAGAANAQSYVATHSTAPFAPLTNPVVPTLQGTLDAGFVTVPLPFNFPFYGRSYAQLTVTTDGAAYLVPSPGTASYPANTVLPSGAAPNGVLAPFWDNLRLGNAFSRIAHQTSTGPAGQIFTVEWRDLNHWSASATYSLTFQLKLHENGRVQFHYGVLTGAGAMLTASIGIENHTGTQGTVGRSCTPNCTPASVQEDDVISFGPASGTVDLVAGELVVLEAVDVNGQLELTTRFELRNFGSDPVAGVDYALFLSTDTTLDASDLPLSPASQGPLSFAPLGAQVHEATSTVPRPQSGAYYVLAQIDPDALLTETSRANNLASTPTPLVSGVDLVARAISSAQSTAGPGDPVTSTLTFVNAGIDPAGPTTWRILLSRDTLVDGGDYRVHEGTLPLGGGQTVTLQETFPLPPNVPLGEYWFVLQVERQGGAPELFENNNTAFSTAKLGVMQADLVVGTPTLHDPLPPHLPAPQLYFGEPFRMEVPVANVGGGVARDFSLVAFLSDNDTLNAVLDPEAGESPRHTLQPGESTTVVLEGVVPESAPNGTVFSPKDYLFFVSAFPHGNFVEVTQSNNTGRSNHVYLRAPGPDLLPTLVQAPSRIAAGEVVPLKRVLRNLGNRASQEVPYRYFLSKNAQLTELDVPLLRVDPLSGGALGDGTVALDVEALDAMNEHVLVPHGLPPGTWHLGVMVDPGRAHDDIRRDNDALSGGEVELVPPVVTLRTTYLPEPILEVPYHFQLVAEGGRAPRTFTVIDGALPHGLVLSAEGRVSGVPEQLGVFPFTLRVEDAEGNPTMARLVLQTVPQTASMSIVTGALPAAVVERAYSLKLGVQGGQAPYTWRIEGGALPRGLALSPEGRLHGSSEEAPGTVSAFEVRVFGAAGQAAARGFTLQTVSPHALVIPVESLPPAQVGQPYLTDLVARVPGAAVLPPPVRWRLSAGVLPDGLSLVPTGPEAVVIEGTPTRAGAFPFGLQVQDGAGRSEVRDFVLVVHAHAARLHGRYARTVLPGTVLDGSIRFEGEPAATYRLHGGALPPGLRFSEDGALTGTIPDEARRGLYSFTIEGRAQDGATGTGAFHLEITDRFAEAGGCGCGAGADGVVVGGIGWVLLAATGRRRRRGESSRSL